MDTFIAEIRVFGFNFAPQGWALCNGQVLPIAQNTALFSLLGTTYGGDGKSTFALPNLNGRALIGSGGGPGLTFRNAGDTGGVVSETLTVQEMPSHTHSARAQATNTAPAYGPAQNVWAPDAGGNNAYGPPQSQVQMAAGALAQTGQGQAHNSLQPYLAMNYCIALSGVYPSRN